MAVQLRIPVERREAKGVVYTRRWVVDLILDLVGYRPELDLAAMTAVEPAAGEGAFLIPMVERLLDSLRRHNRPITDARDALLAYELDSDALLAARDVVAQGLLERNIDRRTTNRLTKAWLVEGDYLLSAGDAPKADVIVGNPPYIRYDDIPADLYASYRAVCEAMVGRCDIYVGFIEAALKQLRPDGRVGFICADRWMRSAYGVELRRQIVESASVDAVIEMHDAPAFEDEVSAYPAVVVLRKGKQGPALVGSANQHADTDAADGSLAEAVCALAAGDRESVVGFSATTLPEWYGGNQPWPWAEPEELRVLKWLEARFQPLEDPATGTRVGIGVATGADQVFVTTDRSVVEEERLLPLAMSADTRTGELRWSGHYLVNPWNGDGLVDLATYPRFAEYAELHRASLERRNVAKRQEARWYRTIDRVIPGLLDREKLYFPDMKLMTHPVLDRGETYPHHNLYFVTSDGWDLEVLGGLLLSKVAELFVSSYCVKMRGGTLRFQAQYLRRIRVPDPSQVSEEVMARLRDAFRSRDRSAATSAAIEAYKLRELAGSLQ